MSALLTAGGASGAAGGDLNGTYPNPAISVIPTVVQSALDGKATSAQGALADTALQNAAAFAPAASGVAADSGWTANSSAGSKTEVIPDFLGAGALAGVDEGANTCLVALRYKVQAIQAALAAALRPNT